MAGLLSARERASERLMRTVSKHVIYPHLRAVGYEVGVSEGKISQIIADTPNDSQSQIFKVRTMKNLIVQAVGDGDPRPPSPTLLTSLPYPRGSFKPSVDAACWRLPWYEKAF